MRESHALPRQKCVSRSVHIGSLERVTQSQIARSTGCLSHSWDGLTVCTQLCLCMPQVNTVSTVASQAPSHLGFLRCSFYSSHPPVHLRSHDCCVQGCVLRRFVVPHTFISRRSDDVCNMISMTITSQNLVAALVCWAQRAHRTSQVLWKRTGPRRTRISRLDAFPFSLCCEELLIALGGSTPVGQASREAPSSANPVRGQRQELGQRQGPRRQHRNRSPSRRESSMNETAGAFLARQNNEATRLTVVTLLRGKSMTRSEVDKCLLCRRWRRGAGGGAGEELVILRHLLRCQVQ